MAKERITLWTEEEDNFLRKGIAENLSNQSILETYFAGKRTLEGIVNRISRLRQSGRLYVRPTVSPIPSANTPIEELLRRLESQDFPAKQEHHEAKRHVEVRIPEEGPYALLFFGDCHLGDPGCDIGHLKQDLDRVRNNEHVYGINIGDFTNNWIGTLQRLYAKQKTTDDEEIALMEWLLQNIPWLFVILGNHDVWGPISSRLCKDNNIPYAKHGARLEVFTRDSDKPLRIDVRHTHKGNSQYNPSHAQLVQNYRGNPCHIVIGGHIHQGAMTMVGNGISETLGFCTRLGAYKRYDDYADQLGFFPDIVGPSCLFVIDPSSADNPTGFVQPFWDIDKGIRYLAMLRAEYGESYDQAA
jgi:hypothetical protein